MERRIHYFKAPSRIHKSAWLVAVPTATDFPIRRQADANAAGVAVLDQLQRLEPDAVLGQCPNVPVATSSAFKTGGSLL